MSLSTDGDAVFFEDGVELLDEIAGEGYANMLFEFTPFKHPPQETTFDLRGLAAALKPLREACGW